MFRDVGPGIVFDRIPGASIEDDPEDNSDKKGVSDNGGVEERV
jgi:hypothetical protein